MRYILKAEIKREPDSATTELWDLYRKGQLSGLPASHTTITTFLHQEISEETFNFIQNVAEVRIKAYGEKIYLINGIEFTIQEKQ